MINKITESEQKGQSSFLKSNIIQLLSIFSKEEMKEFEKFVKSPFHNNRAEVTRFFDSIKKFYPGFNQKDFTKEKIFYGLYSGDKYRDDVVRRLCSNLYKLGEEFAAYKNFRQDSFNSEKSILDFFLSRNADKFYLKQISKIRKQLEDQVLRDPEYYLKLSTLDEQYRVFMLKYDPNYKKVSFNTQIDLMWKFLLSSMLRLYGFAEYEKFFFNKDYELKYKNELLKISSESGFMNSKTIEIYYLLLKLYDGNNNEELFNRIKVLIDGISGSFSKSECFHFYIHLFNYLNICKMNSDKDFSKEEFEISRKLVENDLLVHNGTIDPGWFRGIFAKALNAGEIVFADKFIEKNLITECENVKDNDFSTFSTGVLVKGKQNEDSNIEWFFNSRKGDIASCVVKVKCKVGTSTFRICLNGKQYDKQVVSNDSDWKMITIPLNNVLIGRDNLIQLEVLSGEIIIDWISMKSR